MFLTAAFALECENQKHIDFCTENKIHRRTLSIFSLGDLKNSTKSAAIDG
jgi:hypothetical protein